jgi:subtilisin
VLHSVKLWTLPILAAALLTPPVAGAQPPADDAWIVVYDRAAVDSVDRETDARERARGFHSRLRFRRAIEGFAARLTDAQVRALRADPDVEAVVRDRPVRAVAAQPPASGEPLSPTGVRRIGLGTAAWVREASTVNVAVVDTGVDLDHPDLNVANGVDCVAPGTTAEDENGHGTHVAGTIGGENDGAGVTGVAPGTRLQAVRVLDAAGEGSTSTVLCGIDWVIANASARGIRVINMSLAGPGSTDTNCGKNSNGSIFDAFHEAICRASAAGILSVVAAGNESSDVRSVPVDPDDPTAGTAPGSPASYPEVLTVTAINDHDGAPGALSPTTNECGIDDRRAQYSNFATAAADRAHTIAAPGTCIASTWLSGGYNTISGTSMATPHVAGAAALCIGEAGSAGPCAGLTTAQTIVRLRDEARAFRLANPGSGFAGDPDAPLANGNYYGYLIRPLLAGPQTSFTSIPPETDDDTTPTFAFASPTPGATFECSLDGAAFAACSSPHTTGALADGLHQLAVRAVDVAGNRDATPAADGFVVDAVPDPPPPAPPADPQPPGTTTTTAPPADPEPPVSTTTADTLRPTVTLRAASRQRLGTVLRRGIRVSVLCSEACRAEATVVIPSAAAIKLRISKTAITAGRKALPMGSGRRYVTIRLTSAIRKRLARARSVLVQLRLTATDAAGNRGTAKKAVRLAR